MNKNSDEKVIGQCALCKKENVILENSHIIPKFVFRRIIKKSITGFMRNPFEPNERLQDGDKRYLLCGECEDLFNTSETKFANKIFHIYKSGKLTEFEYEEWLNYFITSVNWRNLYLDIIDFKNTGTLSTEKLNFLIDSEVILRDYLLGKRSDISNIQNHIFFFDDIKSADQKISASDPHSFFRHSSFGYTFLCNDYDSNYVISNISGILIVTILKKSNLESWQNTLVNLDKGCFKVKNQYIKSPIMGDLIEYMNESREAEKNISEKEYKKILNSTMRDKNKLINSEIYKNKVLDFNLKK